MNWFTSLFQPQAGYSGTFMPDMSGMSTYGDIGIDPSTSAFDSNMGTYDPAAPYYDIGGGKKDNMALAKSLMGMQNQQQQKQKNINAMNQMAQMGMIRGGQVANNPNLLDLMTVRTPNYSQIYSLI
jgi:hypothetical protein